MKWCRKVKAFAWIFVLSVTGAVLRFAAAEEDFVIIKINGTTERKQKCDGLNEWIESSPIEITSSNLDNPCSCTLSALENTSVSNLNEVTETNVKPSQGEDNIAFEVLLPCKKTKSVQLPLNKLEFITIPSNKQSPEVFLISEEKIPCKLPVTVTNRGTVHLKCQVESSTYTIPPDPDVDITSHNSDTKLHHNISFIVLYNTNTSMVNRTNTAVGDGESKTVVNSPLMHSRPAHNNVVVIVIICVLVAVIVLAGSMILVSLVMHRKRLARRLIIHLRNLEEAGHPEAVPLTDMPDKQSEHHVQLVGIRRLDSSGCEQNVQDCGFQPVSPTDMSAIIHPEYDKTEGDKNSYNNNEHSDTDCDRISIKTESSAHETFTAVKDDTGSSTSEESGSYEDSVGDNLEESLTVSDTASHKEDKSVQTFNMNSYFQMLPSVMKNKIPKLRWRTKSCDSEHI